MSYRIQNHCISELDTCHTHCRTNNRTIRNQRMDSSSCANTEEGWNNQTVNKVASVDSYPIIRIDYLYAKLSNGKLFTRLHMRLTYEELHLDRESITFVTNITHRGLFTNTRITYSVSSAQSIFQCVIDVMFQGIPNILCYLDDFLITCSSDEQSMDTSDKVLDKLPEAGIHLKQSKCEFRKHSIIFLGHKVDKDGVHPAIATLDAICVLFTYVFSRREKLLTVRETFTRRFVYYLWTEEMSSVCVWATCYDYDRS